MEIKLSKAESEEYFYNALCNALGSGYMRGYGLVLEVDQTEYSAARDTLKASNTTSCYEDILMQVLREGGTLTFLDEEDEDNSYPPITLAEVHERVSKTPLDHLLDMIKERDDACTADVILQTVFFNDIVYG